MRLDQELVQRNLCESRGEAQEMIQGGFVVVDGEVSTKQTKQVTSLSTIEVTSRRKFVSRGGEKLEGALTYLYGNHDAIRSFCANKSVLDVGSSTGGFTDCLLSYGGAHVDAVDVGTLQLHPKLKADKRVSLHENTDIRTFTNSTRYDVIVADLSFIPLQHVFESIVNLGKIGTAYILLLKPQFEVGKGNTKKGIVKDDVLVRKVLETYESLAKEKGLADVKTFPCVIQGGDGNQEYFLYGVHT